MTEPRTKRGTAVEEPTTPDTESAPDDETTEAQAVAAPEAESMTAAAEAPAEAEPTLPEPAAGAEPESEAGAEPEAGTESVAEPVAVHPAADAEPEVAPEPAAAAPEAGAEMAVEANTAAAEPEPAASADATPVAEATPATEAEAAPSPSRSRATAVANVRPLRDRYLNDVVPGLTKQFEYANPNMVPRIDKIVVNVGLGEALTNAKAIDAAAGDLTLITGQKPIVTKARRSIAQFKIREGNPIGLKVTLRGPRMWDFLERLTLLALPRIRDFRGIPGRSFDGRGNYSLGLREQIAFPEIDYDKVDRLRGLEVSIVTTAKSDEESKRMLELLGMPFAS